MMGVSPPRWVSELQTARGRVLKVTFIARFRRDFNQPNLEMMNRGSVAPPPPPARRGLPVVTWGACLAYDIGVAINFTSFSNSQL